MSAENRKCFLTSSPIISGSIELNPANGFISELRRCLKPQIRMLFICANPDIPEKTDRFAENVKTAFEEADFSFADMVVLDGRNSTKARNLIQTADFIVLAGGHVPTQNRFFEDIGLRQLISDFDGVLMGISAGSMNSADTVYAQPEMEGEALDPEYHRFLKGLALTETMLLPHLQMIRADVLDGLRVFEDIAFPDSMGKKFYAIPDGSYLFVHDCVEELRGEAHLIQDGKMTQVSAEGEVLILG